MRYAIVVLIGMTSSAAAFECPWGQEGALVPIRWSAKAEGLYTNMRLGVENALGKDIVMVDAGVWFVDPLGRTASDQGAELDPDLKVPAAAPIITEGNYLSLDRLVGAAFEDFTAHICTRAVLFADGTKATF